MVLTCEQHPTPVPGPDPCNRVMNTSFDLKSKFKLIIPPAHHTTMKFRVVEGAAMVNGARDYLSIGIIDLNSYSGWRTGCRF